MDWHLYVSFVHILKDVDKKKIAALILLAFSKAFDSIVHDRLLYKISALGAASATLKWFKSYLSGYSQTVRIGSTAILRKVVGKSTRDNPERYCGWLWGLCSSKKFERRVREATDTCRFNSFSRYKQCIGHIPYYLSGLSHAHFFWQPFLKQLYTVHTVYKYSTLYRIQLYALPIITHGVPQGAILSPLPFCVYLNAPQ